VSGHGLSGMNLKDPVTTSPLPLVVPAPPQGPPKGRLFRRLAAYAASRGATEAMLGVRGVALALLLGPAAFGTWALLRLSTRYSALVGFAVLRGLEREMLRGNVKRGTKQAHSSAAAALGFVLLACGGVAGLGLAASFVVAEPTYRLLLRGFAAATLTEAVYNYALTWIRVRSSLRIYGLLETGTAVLHVLCAVSLGWVWGLPGAFGGLVVANLVGIAVASRWVEFRLSFRLQPLGPLLGVGLPITLSICVGILLSTADRWVVAAWGGPAMLGYYAFAASVMTPAIALGQVIRTVVFPQVYGEASSAGPATAVQAHMGRALLPFARLLPPILGLLGLLAGPIIALASPGYLQAVAPARLFVLVGAATGLVTVASVGAVAAGRQRQLPLYAGMALVLTLGLSILALDNKLGLEAVAGAAFAGNLFFAAAVLRLNVREAGLANPERFALLALLPLAWCTAAVAGAGALFPGADAGCAARAIGVYLFLLLPLAPAWRGEWRRLRN
jgi:O-antigen/teichoic acid export membrane protein